MGSRMEGLNRRRIKMQLSRGFPNRLSQGVGACLVAMLALFVERTPVAAVPITVSGAFDILDVRSVNSVGSATGTRIFFGANTVIPNGAAGTTASAQTVNLTTGQPVTQSLPFVGSTAIPNQFGRTIPDDPNLRGPWTLTFVNGTNTQTAT